MARTTGIGIQDFSKIIKNNCFYVDKTAFIKEWWENHDEVTLITRPRRFGKTLTISMVEQFFSLEYAGRGDLFEGLSIWQEESYRQLQGTFPVISLSFANIKDTNYPDARKKICQLISHEYSKYNFLLEGNCLSDQEKDIFRRKTSDMENVEASLSINQLSEFLYRYFGQKVIILLDEYDTPLHEAYIYGFWDEISALIRNLFNATFKTNPWMERAIMTGITRISKESIFSDLNHLEVVTTTSNKYGNSFGFTEEEVFAAMDEFGFKEKEDIKKWYDGFRFGKWKDIYNPWSILNYLDKRQLAAYWANTSSNRLVNQLIQQGSPDIKMAMTDLLQGKTFRTTLEEQIIFSQLNQNDDVVWSLLLSSGYLRTEHTEMHPDNGKIIYDLMLTNLEVRYMFEQMIDGWFGSCRRVNNAFLKALLEGNLEDMNDTMNELAGELFSAFDTGRNPSERTQPERFYHGFVLGLLVELRNAYLITSNKESGLGRYDVMLEPRRKGDQNDAMIIEFKVVHTKKGETLEKAAKAALAQIEKKQYAAVLHNHGIPMEHIRKYGFAFQGSNVLIETNEP